MSGVDKNNSLQGKEVGFFPIPSYFSQVQSLVMDLMNLSFWKVTLQKFLPGTTVTLSAWNYS